jgi:hypothetical protein
MGEAGFGRKDGKRAPASPSWGLLLLDEHPHFGTKLSTFTSIKVFFGTGVAPTNGAAITGTQVGNVIQSINSASNSGGAFVNGGIITGLSAGTAYWFDASLASNNGANTAAMSNLSCNAFEVM